MPAIEAQCYEKLPDNKVRCYLCPHQCLINEGRRGVCRVRVNEGGALFTQNYGEVTSLALDPIEKKPLYHFYPGSLILSAGTFGCNLACSFCQNYSIAHGQPETTRISPEDLVKLAVQTRTEGSLGVAFTYNEPSIWYEYVYPTARQLREQGLKTVLVTNGFISLQPFKKLIPFVDAMNIDVKAFNNQFYQGYCRGSLDKVQATVEEAAGQVHVEVTNLVIPGVNDDPAEIRSLARWLAALDKTIPLHLSRYYPAYKMQLPSTPVETLYKVHDIAREYLDFVYMGNIPGESNNTLCQQCGNILVKRQGYQIDTSGIKNKRCADCRGEIDYIIM
ncbi:MAG: AmmeMemoRadiSam system radical SAM enzyme [Syntrophomonadaceae bacterium]